METIFQFVRFDKDFHKGLSYSYFEWTNHASAAYMSPASAVLHAEQDDQNLLYAIKQPTSLNSTREMTLFSWLRPFTIGDHAI